MKERDLIRFVRERCPPGPGVLTGIGDDAAVIEGPGGEPLVITTDLLVEGTHFRSTDDPEQIGRKALAVSVSDIAAMGCAPKAAVLAVAFRPEQSEDFARAVLAGVTAVAREFAVPLVGGDTTMTSGPAVLVSTVVGGPPEGGRPVLRSGATAGEKVLVTGRLGGSLSGRHLVFPPRLPEALELVEIARPGALIDLSDGLSTDAGHVATASGVGIRIVADRIPVSAAALDAGDERTPLDHALSDGEDFELLFTLPADAAARVARAGLAGTEVNVVGDIIEGPARVLIVGADGKEEVLRAGGYEHFG
jgi:thiamine-monophosphate kinase